MFWHENLRVAHVRWPSNIVYYIYLSIQFCSVQSSRYFTNNDGGQHHINTCTCKLTCYHLMLMTSDCLCYSGSQLEVSFKLLHESEDKLRTIVHNKFDAAVHSGDLASVERFFKIFPLVGLHEEGLTKYGKFLAAQVGIVGSDTDFDSIFSMTNKHKFHLITPL